MTELAGLSHLSLSVSDRDASVRWYVDVLGFQVVVADMDGERWKRSICGHPSGLIVGLTEHRQSMPFDCRHHGMDHVAFAVGDRDQLAGWSTRFDEMGVDHSAPVETPFGPVVSFRDPDGIQLEIHCWSA